MNIQVRGVLVVGNYEKVHQIMKSFKEVNRALYYMLLEESDELNLTVIQFQVLYFLDQSPNASLGQLSEELLVGNSTMSGIVERLVKAGLIERERSASDRRTLTMRLTPKGNKKKDEAYQLLKERLSGLLEMPDKEIEFLLKVHQDILDKLKRG
ncbi:MarR family winged helix-turn-helix transcriptional regulator [Scopulibacillus daqui]|uniref:MarR family winged helix-turn-helix transcriptional regulator n=1 Tax=Scopulibacillus daqui TaxID=1469162 RepID=UPI00196083FC|nr:MarR family transcriptional regulator [Scopulibacillus daqui]